MRSLLLVDGDRNFREALAIAMRLDGFAVHSAESAEEGLRRLESGAFDCCVVDAHLTGADSLLAAASRSGVRVVVTGPYPELLAGAARRHPRAEPLAKPFQANELAERIGAAASRPS